MRASIRSQSRPPRSPKRISPLRLHPPRNPRNSARQPKLQASRSRPLLLLSVGALKPWRKPGLFVLGTDHVFRRAGEGKRGLSPVYYFSSHLPPSAATPSFI